MKHDWYDPRSEKLDEADKKLDRFFGYGSYGVRKCRHCGALQKKTQLQSWGRVSSYYWGPPAGRCKAKEPPIKTGWERSCTCGQEFANARGLRQHLRMLHYRLGVDNSKHRAKLE